MDSAMCIIIITKVSFFKKNYLPAKEGTLTGRGELASFVRYPSTVNKDRPIGVE
jgi:hypothetical protein